MTIPAGSNNPPISIADLNAEFGFGNSLGSYYGKRWYKDNNSRGYFRSSGAFSLSEFAGTRYNSPVTAGSVNYYSSQTIAFPMFNNLTVTVVSGQGGQGGYNGNCAAGGYGGYGGASSFGGYVATSSGNRGAPSGGAGSQSSNSTSWAINDSNQATIIALYNLGVSGTVGAGGGGGSTGYNTRVVTTCLSYDYYYGVPVCTNAVNSYYCDSPSGGGATGSNGYISLSWT